MAMMKTFVSSENRNKVKVMILIYWNDVMNFSNDELLRMIPASFNNDEMIIKWNAKDNDIIDVLRIEMNVAYLGFFQLIN